ncbi:MAG TPA: kelch repeat-containing protein [Thermomicrobiales bacterium]|jgi:N-acetylneuraminic acid mutarotase
MNAYRQGKRTYRRFAVATHRLILFGVVVLLVACSRPGAATPTAPPPPTVAATAAATSTSGGTATVTLAAPTRATGTASRTPIGTPIGTIGAPGGGVEASGGWVNAGSLLQARAGHTASILPDGRVLIIGGERSQSNANSLGSAEIYDPRTNIWSSGPAMNLGRMGHTATPLPTGQVLVVGGDTVLPGMPATVTNSVELFDPATNSWRPAAAASLGRQHHTATVLPDGRVLIVGGETIDPASGQQRVLASAELYDPRTNSWSRVGDLGRSRVGHTAIVLPDGRVVVSGGETVAADGQRDVTPAVEIFDPASGAWADTGSLSTGRAGHTANLLPDGRILIVGGQTAATRGGGLQFVATRATTVPAASAEVFDPQAGTWRPIASLASPRSGHSATLLPSGQLLVVGGYAPNGTTPLGTAERYDPTTNIWSLMNTPTARAEHTATLLADGSLLIVGGKDSPTSYIDQVDRYISRTTAPSANPTAMPSTTPLPTPEPSSQPSPTVRPTSTPVPPTTAPRTPTIAPPTPTNVRPTTAPPTAPPVTTVPPTSQPPPTATPVAPTSTPVPPTAPPVVPTSTPIPPTVVPTAPSAPPTSTPTIVVPTAPPTLPPRAPTATATPAPAKPGTVFGIVQGCYNGDCSYLTGVLVSATGLSTRTSQGSYLLSNVPAGSVTVTVSGAVNGSKTVTVPASGRVEVSFTLDCKDPTACGFKP